jgi:hypothetical protein
MSIAQGRIYGLSSSRKGRINTFPKTNHYENMDILGIKVSGGIIE